MQAWKHICYLSRLLPFKLSSEMVHKKNFNLQDNPEYQLELDGFHISLFSLVIGIESALICFPANMALVFLFRNIGARPHNVHSHTIKMHELAGGDAQQPPTSRIGQVKNHEYVCSNNCIPRPKFCHGIDFFCALYFCPNLSKLIAYIALMNVWTPILYWHSAIPIVTTWGPSSFATKANIDCPSIHLSIHLLAGVAQIEATGPEGPISDLWKP